MAKQVKTACPTDGATGRLLLIMHWTRYGGQKCGRGVPSPDSLGTTPPLISVKLCCATRAETGAMPYKNSGAMLIPHGSR
jgi:hypothetical protein